MSAEVGGQVTSGSADNPRTGSLRFDLAGTWDASQSISLFGSAQYTRDLATKTAESASPGSDVWLLGLGATWAPSEHWLTMVSLTASPPARARNATTVTASTGATADVVVASRSSSVGGLALVSWSSAGTSNLESMVDAVFGATRFEVFQQLELGTGPRAEALQSTCQGAVARRAPLCSLVSGTSSPLTQFRLGGGYTATLFTRTDLGLEAAAYLYDGDPMGVGYFSLVALGRVEVGAGVPVLPLLFSVRPSVTHRFAYFIVRLAYQAGLYRANEGMNHSLSLRLTWLVTRRWRLWVSGAGQVDATKGGLANTGLSAAAGALLDF